LRTHSELDPLPEPSIPVVSMHNIAMSFAGVPVLRGVDFEVMRGEVHALLGENGAGKSTLMKVLEGVHKPDSGQIAINGKEVTLGSARDAKLRGVIMVFQEFSLIPTLTVAQNILLGREPRTVFGLTDEDRTVAIARRFLKEMGSELDPRLEVGSLAASYWQITEIAKALSQDATVLVLDEPTATLTKDETNTLFQRVRILRDAGMAIVYISHRMAEIYDIADRITVMRNGTRIRTARVTEYPIDGVIADMLGNQEKRPQLAAPKQSLSPSNVEPVLRIKNLHSDGGIRGITLDVKAGEILGLAGLMGSGRSQLVRAIFGVDKITAGSISVGGEEVKISSPRDAIRVGIALVPEDRRTEGLVLDHSLEANAELPLVVSKHKGWIRRSETSRIAREVIDRLDVRTSSGREEVGLLSGGNQQKVVIGKWLLTEPRVFMLDEPTAGIDIGAKQEIMQKLREFAAAGKAVIIISSELEELLKVSDRIVVLRNGLVDGVYGGDEFTSEGALHRAVQGV
jgi:ribose transport system ATP-binding protein